MICKCWHIIDERLQCASQHPYTAGVIVSKKKQQEEASYTTVKLGETESKEWWAPRKGTRRAQNHFIKQHVKQQSKLYFHLYDECL